MECSLEHRDSQGGLQIQEVSCKCVFIKDDTVSGFLNWEEATEQDFHFIVMDTGTALATSCYY
jgi:hypothetical protein